MNTAKSNSRDYDNSDMVVSISTYERMHITSKYNFLTYSTHQRYIEIDHDYISVKSSGPGHRRQGNSLMINLGIAYKINFARF